MGMKHLTARYAGLFLLLTLASMASAQDQKKTSTKEDRLSGTIHMIDKDTSSIVIRKGAVPYKVVYKAETKFTIQNQSGSIDDVIVGRRVICVGTFNAKTGFLATRVEVRTN